MKADDLKLQVLTEIREQRSEPQNQDKVSQKDEDEWRFVSRALHWRNSLDQLGNLTPTKDNLHLKTVLVDDYVQGAPINHLISIKKKQQDHPTSVSKYQLPAVNIRPDSKHRSLLLIKQANAHLTPLIPSRIRDIRSKNVHKLRKLYDFENKSGL